MITDLQVQHELLKTALQATDNYLAIEKRATEAGAATNAMIHDFSYHMTRAHDALQTLGVLDQHEKYMETHVQEMLRLHGHKDQTIADLPYAHVPKADVGEVEESVQEAVWDKPSPVKNSKKLTPEQKAKAKSRARSAGRPYPNMVDNIWAARQESAVIPFSQFLAESKKSGAEDEIQQIVDSLEWEDMVDLYEEDDLIYEEYITEKLSAQARMRKKQAFSRMRTRRNVAKGIKLKRASTPEVLKKRAVIAARNAVYRTLLRGRDKSKLSAAEKDRIEQQVKRLKSIQSSLVPRLLPKMRSIEQKRLAGYRGGKK